MKRRNWMFDFKEYKKSIIINSIANIVMVGALLFLDELKYSNNYLYFVLILFCINGINGYRCFNVACENEKKKEKMIEMQEYKEKIAKSIINSCHNDK